MTSTNGTDGKAPTSVSPGWRALDQDEAAILPALATVNMATVISARV